MWGLPFREVLLLWVHTMHWQRGQEADRLELHAMMAGTAGMKDTYKALMAQAHELRRPIVPPRIPDEELLPWERLARKRTQEMYRDE
jgi:hypothetical protein